MVATKPSRHCLAQACGAVHFGSCSSLLLSNSPKRSTPTECTAPSALEPLSSGPQLTLPSLPADFYSEAAPLRSRRAMAAARPLNACVHRSRARTRADARGRGAGRGPPQVRWGSHVRCTVPGMGRGGVLTPGRSPTAFALGPKTPCFELPAGPSRVISRPGIGGVPLRGLE